MPSTLPPEFEVVERASTRLSGVLTQDDGITPVPNGTLATFTLTIYALDVLKTLIVDHRSILTSVDAATAAFAYVVPASDMAILDATLPVERHVCLFEWTWGTTGQGRKELALAVRNLAKVA